MSITFKSLAAQFTQNIKSLLSETVEIVTLNSDNIKFYGTEFKRLHDGPFPTQILGKTKEDLAQIKVNDPQQYSALIGELETHSAQVKSIKESSSLTSLNQDGYMRFISLVGKNMDSKNPNTTLVLAAEIYETTNALNRIFEEREKTDPNFRKAYADLSEKRQFTFFMNYAYDAGEFIDKSKLSADEFKELRLKNGNTVKDIQYGGMTQLYEAQTMVEKIGGTISNAFFECENAQKVKQQFGEELSLKSQARPKLFGSLIQKITGQNIVANDLYPQPDLEGLDKVSKNLSKYLIKNGYDRAEVKEMDINGLKAAYNKVDPEFKDIGKIIKDLTPTTHLNGYFVPGLGKEKVSAMEQLAFVDTFTEVFTGLGIREHALNNKDCAKFVDEMQKQITEEHTQKMQSSNIDNGQIGYEKGLKIQDYLIKRKMTTTDRPPVIIPADTETNLSGLALNQNKVRQ